MARAKSDYSKGLIYKITCDKDIYVGSTIQTINRRKIQHKSGYKKQKNICKSFILFDKYGFDNCIFELIELFPSNSRKELERREGEWIRKLDCVNRIMVGRTKEEYHVDNKETRNAKSKKHYEDNKEHYNERSKKYSVDNKDTISKQRKKKYAEGKKSPDRAKLTEEQVIEIRKNYIKLKGKRSNITELAEKYGVSRATITNIINGKSWKHLLPKPTN